ncbi:MAG: hypothetical protein GF403_07890 [Candidatus Coatesbacteria bacterium]|nr:hypothetical protein [Candidatus Coatesbacteria bacterium]
MRKLLLVVLCLLVLTTLALAETIVFQPGVDDGKDAEIDNKQGTTPHGNYPFVLMPLGG